MDYFEAYSKRMERNSKQLLELADELTLLGYSVKYYNSNRVSGITIYNDSGEGVRLQFNEVPYRWSLEYDIKPSKETGSSFIGEERWNESEIPFTIEDLVNNLKPMYVSKTMRDFRQLHK